MGIQLDLDRLVGKVATTSLPGHDIASIATAPDVDADGLEGLRVTVVLVGDDASLSGDEMVNVIVDLRQALQEVGDDRFPFVDFTNESELAADADSQPGPPA